MGNDPKTLVSGSNPNQDLEEPKNLVSGSNPNQDLKRDFYDSLPQDQKDKKSYTEWLKEAYDDQYEKWMPWIEDQYLKWFGRDNKASYVTKDTLGKSKVTGVSQVDKLQDDTNNLVGNQLGKDGLLQPIGDLASKEGVNRAERGGKDDSGSYAGSVPGGQVADSVINNTKAGGQVTLDKAKGAGGYIGGLVGAKGSK